MQKPKYGIDAPGIIRNYLIATIVCIVIATLIALHLNHSFWWALTSAIFYAVAVFCLYPIVSILLGSLYFKFRERDWLFENLPLIGNEKILDIGCGRGLLSIAAAKKLNHDGKVYGLDLWVKADQASNSSVATKENIKIEKLEDKIEIIDGDMRHLPFENESFSIILSSWAIHNLRKKEDRDQTLVEIARVLKPGGKVAILDIEFAPQYANFFFTHGFSEVQRLGPRHTFGWPKTYLVLATK